MKLFILVMFLMQGCTMISYTTEDGRALNYWSTKDQTASIVRNVDGYSIHINAVNEANEALESIAKGVVGGVK